MRVRVPGRGLPGLLAFALVVASCGSSSASGANSLSEFGAPGAVPPAADVGVDLPDNAPDARWVHDGPTLVKTLQVLGYRADLQYASDDAQTQVNQVERMIAARVKLLVIGAVEATALTATLQKAADAGIKVLAYDRLILGSANVDAYVSFDSTRVGTLQATMIEQALGLKAKGGPFSIELFAGSPDDNNASLLFTGAMAILQPDIDSGRLVVRSGQTAFPGQVGTQGWDPTTAFERMRGLLAEHYASRRLDAVLSPNDGISAMIVSALKEAGYYTAARPGPVVTGEDAVLDAVRSIRAGEQSSTVFKDTRLLAAQAATMAVELLKGTAVDTNGTHPSNNGVKNVPTFLLDVVLVTKDNIQSALLDTGYYSPADLP